MALTDNDLPKLVELLNQIQIRMQQRRKTAAEWTASNEVLRDGELGIESDTRGWKVGNGVDGWNTRPYASGNGLIYAEFDGAGDVLAPAQSRPITIPYAFRILRWRLATGGEEGSVAVDVLKASSLGATPASIVGSIAPTLSDAAYASGADLTGWTATGAAGNAIVFAISGINTITGLRVELEVQKT